MRHDWMTLHLRGHKGRAPACMVNDYYNVRTLSYKGAVEKRWQFLGADGKPTHEYCTGCLKAQFPNYDPNEVAQVLDLWHTGIVGNMKVSTFVHKTLRK